MYLRDIVILFICIIHIVKGDNETAPLELEAKTAHNTYDYIVVGTGQGGSVAAARLAESGARVLVSIVII